MGVGDVERVVIERGQRPDNADQHRHRMRIAAEAAEKLVHLLVYHGVVGDHGHELELLLCVRQLAFEQQVADLQKVAIHRQLLDRITAIEKLALVAVDIGDRRRTGGRRHEAGIVGKVARLAVQRPDIDDLRADRSRQNRKADRR